MSHHLLREALRLIRKGKDEGLGHSPRGGRVERTFSETEGDPNAGGGKRAVTVAFEDFGITLDIEEDTDDAETTTFTASVLVMAFGPDYAKVLRALADRGAAAQPEKEAA